MPMISREHVPFIYNPEHVKSWEEIAQDAAAEASQLRAELALAQTKISTLESELADSERKRLIERGRSTIAQRDRDTATGNYRPIETSVTWRCGKCGSDILRHFVYCPLCCGHIDWAAVVCS